MSFHSVLPRYPLQKGFEQALEVVPVGPFNRALTLGFWLLLSLATAVAQAGDANKVVVFDLDNVVLFHPGADTPSSKIVRAETDLKAGGDPAAKADRYRLADGFPELLQSLVESGWKVHVYSFGNATRNNSVLRAIRLPDGSTAADAVAKSGGKVFTNEDGFHMAKKERARFEYAQDPSKREPIVKSLAQVLGPDEAKKAVIVDDIPGNIHPSERTSNVLYLPFQWTVKEDGKQSKDYQEDFSATEAELRGRGDMENLAEGRRRFRRQNDKIPYVAGLLTQAEEIAAKTGQSIPKVLAELQYKTDQDGNVLTDNKGVGILKDGLVDDLAVVAKGRERLRTVGLPGRDGFARPSTARLAPCLGSLAAASPT